MVTIIIFCFIQSKSIEHTKERQNKLKNKTEMKKLWNDFSEAALIVCY